MSAAQQRRLWRLARWLASQRMILWFDLAEPLIPGVDRASLLLYGQPGGRWPRKVRR